MAVRKTNSVGHHANSHANGGAGDPSPAPARRVHWNETHRDLDRALAAAGLSPCEAIIVERARELAYAAARMAGSPEPLPFAINISELARAYDVSRKALNMGLSRLRTATLLIPAEKLFRLNKDYASWVDPHKLTARQIDTCRTGRFGLSLEETHKRRGVLPNGNTPEGPGCYRSVTGGVTDRYQVVLPIGNSLEPPPKNPPLGREDLEDFFDDPDPEKKRAKILKALRGHLAEDDE